jgi:hypothetical protein
MISNLSYRENDVLEFPALLKSKYKTVKVWAERGMVCFDDENREELSWLDPIEALQRVVTMITDYAPAMAASPSQFQVDKSVLLRFADDFKRRVYEKALSQRYNSDGTKTRIIRQKPRLILPDNL